MVTLPKILSRLLAVGLVLALSAAPVAAAPPDKLLPADADIIFHVNVRALLDSDVVKKHALDQVKSLIKESTEASTILTQFNLDPFKDVTTVTTAISLGGAFPPQPSGIAVIRGKFDADKIHSTLAEVAKNMSDKIGVSDVGNLKVYEFKEGNQPLHAVILDKETIVGGTSKQLVEAAIEQQQGKRQDKVKKEVAAALEKADANQTVWLAMPIPSTIKDVAKNAPQGEIVEKIDAVTIGVAVKDNVVTEITLHLNDEKAGEDLRNLIDQGKGAAPVVAAQIPEVGDLVGEIISDIKVTVKGKTVTLRSEVSSEQIEKISKKVKELKK